MEVFRNNLSDVGHMGGSIVPYGLWLRVTTRPIISTIIIRQDVRYGGCCSKTNVQGACHDVCMCQLSEHLFPSLSVPAGGMSCSQMPSSMHAQREDCHRGQNLLPLMLT